MSQVDVPGLGGILSMAHDASGAMWIGGIDADGAGFVGKLEGSDFTIVGAGIDGAVNQLDVVGVNDVLAGGAFAHVGDVAAANIARYDGSKWSALGDGVPGQVTALAHDGATVYVSTPLCQRSCPVPGSRRPKIEEQRVLHRGGASDRA